MSLPKWKFYFQPRDLWIGCFWDRRLTLHGYGTVGHETLIYLCLIPTLVLRLSWRSVTCT